MRQRCIISIIRLLLFYRLAHRTAASFPPRPSQPNPHPTPLTPRTPRGECYGQGVRWWLHVVALSAGRKVRPTSCAPRCIFTTTNAQPSAKIGCGHFVKSPRIVYRLAHRTAAGFGGLPRPPCPPALRGSLAVSAADARIYMFIGGGGRAVVARLFIGV